MAAEEAADGESQRDEWTNRRRLVRVLLRRCGGHRLGVRVEDDRGDHGQEDEAEGYQQPDHIGQPTAVPVPAVRRADPDGPVRAGARPLGIRRAHRLPGLDDVSATGGGGSRGAAGPARPEAVLRRHHGVAR